MLSAQTSCQGLRLEGGAAETGIMNDSLKQIERLERRNSAMKRLLAALRPCLPAQWGQAVLTMDATWSPHTGRRVIRHHLAELTSGEEVTEFPAELFEATASYHAVFCADQENWNQMVLTVSVADRKGNLHATYHYDPGKLSAGHL